MKWQGLLVFGICLSASTLLAQGTFPPPSKSGTTKGSTSGSTAPSTSRGSSTTTPSTSRGTSTPTSPSSPSTSRGTGTGTGTSPGAGTGTSGGLSGPGLNSPGTSASRPAGTLPAASGATTKTGTGAAGAAGAAGNAQSARDYASYAIGLDMAARFQSDDTPVNIEMLVQGLKDGFANAKPRYPEAQLRAAAEAFEKEMQMRAQERFKLVSDKNKKDGAIFLTENKKKKTVKATASGLQYEVIKSGAGKSPRSTDKIRAHYHGTLTDGTVFDTTQNDQPVEIEVNSAIAGWTEALQIMKVGDKWRIYVPSQLAYGEEGFGPVPPNAVLIFDLELLEIVPSAPAGTPVGQGTLPRTIK